MIKKIKKVIDITQNVDKCFYAQNSIIIDGVEYLMCLHWHFLPEDIVISVFIPNSGNDEHIGIEYSVINDRIIKNNKINKETEQKLLSAIRERLGVTNGQDQN